MPRQASTATAESIRHLQEEAAQRIREEVEDLLRLIGMANRLRSQAPEFRPSSAQTRIFEALRGGKRLSRKQVERLDGVGRRAYSGPGSLDALMELGLVDTRAAKFFLTEPGEAMAAEWLDQD